jgi:CrcB protein
VRLALAVAAGGALGAVARHLTGLAALRLFGPHFPWGTLTVNVLGSFLMGILVGVLALRGEASPLLRAFLAVGVLGGFTTFSSFSLDAVTLIERRAYLAALGYVLASLLLSIGALFGGLRLVRVLI